MLNVINITIPFFSLIFFGTFLNHIGFFKNKEERLLAKTAFFVFMPAMIYYKIASTPAINFLNIDFILLYEVSTVAIFLLAYPIGKLFKLELDAIGIFGLCSAYPNYGYIGIPMALIAFGDEGFIKKRYRKFNIKIKKNEQDDYGMMKEVLNRRFKRAIQEKENFLSFPDLVLIDGGKGQYSTAREVLNELGLHDLPIIAIAKGKFRNSGNETFFHNGKEYKFQKNDPTLFFLQRIRDESHRFAISAHRAKRKKGISKSLLDQIEGIGSIRKRALLNHFGSARGVESASLDEIKSVEGVEDKVAKKIYNFFHE